MTTALLDDAVAVRATRRPLGSLGIVSVLVAVLLVIPILVVVAHVFLPSQGTWKHLAETVLGDYVRTTVLLLAGVSVGVVSMGVLTAWLTTGYRFPGRGLLEWTLVLPLAMPAYVMAYAYTDFLQYAGPVQTAYRALTGLQGGAHALPDVRSLWGAVAMFSFALYPYVYLLARAAFIQQPVSLLEAGRLSGRGPWGVFFGVALPLARPAIAAGTALALMETLADFGTVSYFAVNTFTAGIYRAWFSMGDQVAAAQLSVLLLAFVAVLLVVERWNRGRAAYYNVAGKPLTRPIRLRGGKALVAFTACALPPLFGFLLPVLILAHVVWTEPEPLVTPRFLGLIGNSFTLAGVAAVLAVLVALLLAYAARLSRSSLVAGANRIASMGYAVPGAVIAVGILVPLGRIDNLVADAIESLTGAKTGLLLTGTIIAVLYAYLVRFLAIALQTVEAGLGKIRPSMEDAARSLGLTPGQTLRRVHAPIMKGSLMTAVLIVFVDVMKELPATFALRPFNFDTLAVQAYNMAKDERLAEAAVASLVIVAVGAIPLIVLSRAISRGRNIS